MVAYPVTSFPNTAHSVFYAYAISANNGEPIGSFEKFGSSFTRTHERIREVLFSRGPITKEIIWGGTDIQVTLTKVELYEQAIFQALGVQIFSIEEFNQTVNIVETMYVPETPGSASTPSGVNGLRTRVVVYEDCVPTNVTKDVDSSTVKVAENMTLECTTVRGFYA